MKGKKYLKECFVEKIYHFDALDNWGNIKIEKPLMLIHEKDDDGKEEVRLTLDEHTTIGCLSKDDGKDILPFLQQEWECLFSATVISKRDDIETENKRIKVVIYIEGNPKK